MSSEIMHSIQTAANTGFNAVSRIIRKYSLEDIITAVANAFGIEAQNLAMHPMGGYSKGRTSGAYYFVLKDLKENISKYTWLYSQLRDETSRKVFNNLLLYRMCPDPEYLRIAFDGENPQYFDKGIIKTSENEVFVDCGGYIGDTVQSYLSHCGAYKRIYIYEPSAENMSVCHENLSGYSNISLRLAGVGSQNADLLFNADDSSGSFISHSGSESGELTQIVSLDDDILEPVTFIKMDVEGYEIDAINGAKRHIREDNPKLAICLYHIVSDFWEIPQLIHSINPHYRYYLRHYNKDQNWETVLYAIPADVITIENRVSLSPNAHQKKIGVWAISSVGLSWQNHDLLKDCGLVPYMFHSVFGYNTTMLGCKSGEYPYLDMLPGLNMEFLPNCTDIDTHLHANICYLRKHFDEMDLLILYGAYAYYSSYIKEYRKLRPDGKVYLALDANSFWIDGIPWTNPVFTSLFDNCDVIAASCRKMWRHVNRKWSRWTIDYIPNGFFNPTGRDLNVSYEQKENILLTVGRIGTDQKANHVLLEAFARVHRELPDWRVHLVGPIDESFRPYIDEYFQRNPKLREKVIFKGLIEDKNELYAEYSRSKIFIMTSVCEGAPNVIAESLFHGCYQITSDVDAAEDITNNGNIGRIFPINGIDDLTGILRDVCTNKELLKNAFPRILSYAESTFDWKTIIKRLHHMLFCK